MYIFNFRLNMDGDTHQPGEARNIQAIDKQSVHRYIYLVVWINLYFLRFEKHAHKKKEKHSTTCFI